ncbi:CYP27A1, partial [Symbiodinium necroappetens]
MARRLLLFLGLGLQAPLLQAQTNEDVAFMQGSPLGCFVRGFKFDRYIPNKNINTTSLKLCQEHCQYVDGCVKFSYRAFWGECWFADINAVEVPVDSPYLIVGYRTCDAEGMHLPARCSTETPGNGFPGQSAEASNSAWPGGKQPYGLECWPKSWDGAPLPCTQVDVLDDTKNGWPGKCVGLVEMKEINGSKCGENCRQHPECQSWQKTVYNSCWQGLGKDCFVRGNFMPKEAQRLQHGSVRVLKDLTGYQIVGLWKGFDNDEGFFQNVQDAISFCKHMCYSDFRCQYWTYAPNYGCWIEDASQEYGPPFPLTLDAARRDTMFAQDCVAGEYIQHFCPEGSVSRKEPAAPVTLSNCAERGFRYEPPDMFLSFRTAEANYEACRQRCKLTVYCNFFAYWPDGGCHISGGDAHRVPAENYEVISGPTDCSKAYSTTTNLEAWATTAPTLSPVVVQPGKTGVKPKVAHDDTKPVELPDTAHMAEIAIVLHNLDVSSLSEPEVHLLQARYAQALSQTLGVPVDQVQEGPGANDLKAQVKLTPTAGGSMLTAFTLNDPVGSPDPAKLLAKLKVPALPSNLKAATSGAALPPSSMSGPLLVSEPLVGTKEHPLKGPRPQPSFFSQWWPLITVLAIIACIGGGIFIHRMYEEQLEEKRLVASGRGISVQDSDMSVSLKDVEDFDSGYDPSPGSGNGYQPTPYPAPYQSSASYGGPSSQQHVRKFWAVCPVRTCALALAPGMMLQPRSVPMYPVAETSEAFQGKGINWLIDASSELYNRKSTWNLGKVRTSALANDDRRGDAWTTGRRRREMVIQRTPGPDVRPQFQDTEPLQSSLRCALMIIGTLFTTDDRSLQGPSPTYPLLQSLNPTSSPAGPEEGLEDATETPLSPRPAASSRTDPHLFFSPMPMQRHTEAPAVSPCSPSRACRDIKGDAAEELCHLSEAVNARVCTWSDVGDPKHLRSRQDFSTHLSFSDAMALAQAIQSVADHVADRRGAVTIALAGAGASLLAVRLLLRSRVDRFPEVPGYWLLGVLPELGPGAKFLTEKLEEWAEKYGQEGVYEMDLAGSRTVVCCNWQQAHPILSLRPFKMPKNWRIQNVADIIGGSFFSEGDRWKRERRVLSPAFSRKNVESYIPAVECITQQLLREMGRDLSERGETNFSELLPLYTADVICKTALGQEMRMLEKRSSDIVSDVKALFQAFQTRFFAPLPYWKVPGLASFFDNGAQVSKRFYNRSEQILQTAQGGGRCIVDKLKDMDGDKFSHSELMDNLTVLFLAGTDTTSLALCWSFYYLSKDLQLQTAVAQEVRTLPDGEISLTELETLPTVQAVWLETLRCHGPANALELQSTEEITLAGRKLPAGTEFLIAIRNILKNDPEVKKKLGDDLQVFRPSRWLGPDGIVKHAPFDSLAFGYGPRICLGMRLAEYEGLLVIAKVVQKFVLEQWDKPPLMETANFVSNEPASPVSIKL